MVFSLIIIGSLALWMIVKKKDLSQIILYSIFILYISGAIAQVWSPPNNSGKSIIENIKNYPYSELIHIIPLKQQYFDIHQTDAVLRLIKSYLLNILLTMPFGVLFPLIKNTTTRSMTLIAILVGLTAEFVQLLLGMVFGNQYRITHIDDVLMNATGVMLGYAIITLFTRRYPLISLKTKTQV